MKDGSDLHKGAIDEITTGLIRLAQKNEPTAWTKLAYAYSPVVYMWCREKLSQRADAENVGGEVFLAIAKGISDFKGGGKEFRGWIKSITRHKIADFWRRREKMDLPIGGSDALQKLNQVAAQCSTIIDVEEFTDDENQIVLPRLVESIKSQFQESTWRAFYEVAVVGREPAVVADELGMSRNAVFIAKSRVLQRLRDEYDDREIGASDESASRN